MSRILSSKKIMMYTKETRKKFEIKNIKILVQYYFILFYFLLSLKYVKMKANTERTDNGRTALL